MIKFNKFIISLLCIQIINAPKLDDLYCLMQNEIKARNKIIEEEKQKRQSTFITPHCHFLMIRDKQFDLTQYENQERDLITYQAELKYLTAIESSFSTTSQKISKIKKTLTEELHQLLSTFIILSSNFHNTFSALNDNYNFFAFKDTNGVITVSNYNDNYDPSPVLNPYIQSDTLTTDDNSQLQIIPIQILVGYCQNKPLYTELNMGMSKNGKNSYSEFDENIQLIKHNNGTFEIQKDGNPFSILNDNQSTYVKWIPTKGWVIEYPSITEELKKKKKLIKYKTSRKKRKRINKIWEQLKHLQSLQEALSTLKSSYHLEDQIKDLNQKITDLSEDIKTPSQQSLNKFYQKSIYKHFFQSIRIITSYQYTIKESFFTYKIIPVFIYSYKITHHLYYIQFILNPCKPSSNPKHYPIRIKFGFNESDIGQTDFYIDPINRTLHTNTHEINCEDDQCQPILIPLENDVYKIICKLGKEFHLISGTPTFVKLDKEAGCAYLKWITGNDITSNSHW